jgi:hypothetical protein
LDAIVDKLTNFWFKTLVLLCHFLIHRSPPLS